MGLIGVLISVAVAAASRLVADDIKAWLPRMKEIVIEWAVKRLPPEQRDRYAQEWQENVDDTPGELSRFVVGIFLPLIAAANPRPTAFGVQSLPNPEHIVEDDPQEIEGFANLIGVSGHLGGIAINGSPTSGFARCIAGDIARSATSYSITGASAQCIAGKLGG